MPLIATRGAASAQGFGEFAQTAAPVYIEDVFSTYLYTGNGSTQTITNNIDLSGKGGLVWLKERSPFTSGHKLYDTQRGTSVALSTNNADGNSSPDAGVTAFNANGFSLSNNNNTSNVNNSTYASWTFREQPKFFDVVTYTGNGATNRAISHNLGSTPGCIMIKCTSNSASWSVWHQDIGTNQFLTLNTSAAAATDSTQFGGSPTSTTFTVAGGGAQIRTNQNGATYVAYLFAHNAGGFGLTGSDNVISCGSFTTNGSGSATVTLGYEPQWYLQKTTDAGTWWMTDTMRGYSNSQTFLLQPNSSAAEYYDGYNYMTPTATGFTVQNWAASTTYIYIAIRRGPMKTPTTGTSVFSPLLTTNSTGATNTTGFPVDLQLWTLTGGYQTTAQDRLRGVSTTSTQTSCPELLVPYTNAESSNAFQVRNWNNTGFETPSGVSGSSTIWWNFRRAPGFFDEVCYTGTGSNLTVAHNLTVVPELIIAKNRTTAGNNWPATFNFTSTNSSYAFVNLTSAGGNDTYANVGVMTAQPTSTNLFLSPSGSMNTNGSGHVAYLFASCPGVSKVGTYTGTGALQTVNCGFTGGARFILIKRTDSTGDWYVYDSARGISSGNDPYILINVAGAAQVTGTNYVDTTSVGFQVTAAAPAGLNANGGSYLFLAIA